MTKEKVISELISKRNNYMMSQPAIEWDIVYDEALEAAFFQALEGRIGSYGVAALREALDDYNMKITLK